MTEIEAIKKCNTLINGFSINYSVSYAFSENDEVPYPTFRVMEEFANTCKKALEEIQQYREIGTMEEVQAIKQWKSDMIEDFCKYDASSFEELIRNSRNKAIDEFTKRLKDSLKNNFRHLLSVDTDGFEWLTTDAVGTHIDKIAEKMKGGATDEG